MASRRKSSRVQTTRHTFDVTDETFAQALRDHRNLVVDAWAEWCPPCIRLSPILEELARENAGRIAFAKLDTDANPRTAGALNIMSMPTLVLYRDGRRIGEIVGLQPKARLAAALKQAFG